MTKIITGVNFCYLNPCAWRVPSFTLPTVKKIMETLEKLSRTDEIKLKKTIMQEGLKQQQALIDDYRKRIDEIRATVLNNRNGYDSHQHSFKSETMAEISLLGEQLQLANHELEQLMHIQNYALETHPAAEYGTVVKTDRETFFISVGVERFYADGLPVFGISVQSPLYKAMKGKKAGESFIYNGILYHIEEIF